MIQQMAGDVDEITGKRATMIAHPGKFGAVTLALSALLRSLIPAAASASMPVSKEEKGNECANF